MAFTLVLTNGETILKLEPVIRCVMAELIIVGVAGAVGARSALQLGEPLLTIAIAVLVIITITIING